MIFTTWQQAFDIIESWANNKDLIIVWNENQIQCEYQGSYVTKSNGKQTAKCIRIQKFIR